MRKRALIKNEKGFSIIEVTIAIVILGVIAVAFLSGLATASKAIYVADERATAESLARSQMEYVKNQPYDTADVYDPGPPPTGGEETYTKIADAEIPDGYIICSVNRDGATIENIIYGVPWDSQNNQAVDTDAGLQKITLVIKHHGKEIFTFIRDGKKITLEDYKVDR